MEGRSSFNIIDALEGGTALLAAAFFGAAFAAWPFDTALRAAFFAGAEFMIRRTAM